MIKIQIFGGIMTLLMFVFPWDPQTRSLWSCAERLQHVQEKLFSGQHIYPHKRIKITGDLSHLIIFIVVYILCPFGQSFHLINMRIRTNGLAKPV